MSLPEHAAGAPEPRPHPVASRLRRIRDTAAAAPPLFCYPAVVTLTAGAAALSLLARSSLSQSAFLLFYPVVAVAAWMGGLRAGLAASVLSAVAAHTIFFAPETAASARPHHVLLLLTFVLTGAFVSYLTSSLRQARAVADSQRAAANQFAATLHLRLMIAEKEIERLRQAAEVAPQPPAHAPHPPADVPSPASPPEGAQVLPWPIRIAHNGNGKPHGEEQN